MYRKICITLLALGCAASAMAQKKVEPYLNANLTSSYLWRGQRVGGVSFQPSLGIKWQGFDLSVWASEPLSPPASNPNEHEIDLCLSYRVTPMFGVGLYNVYLNTRGDGFLSYGSIPHAANGLEAFVTGDFKYVNVEWWTNIAGNDGYNHEGKRSYSSYFIARAPFKVSQLDCTAELGVVPYYSSRYSEDRASGFHVNMCSLKAQHTFKFNKKRVLLTPYTQLMVNPSSRAAYFQGGVKFSYQPRR